MNKAFRLKMAKQRAEQLVRDEGIAALPVDPFAIAEKHKIIVQPKDEATAGVSGMLLRNGNSFGIMYATHVRSEGFQRFSVAHELGHYFLDGHPDQVLKNGVHESRAGFVSPDPYELEADSFAAGLLMPSTLFRRALNKHQSGLAAIEALAEVCKTSLTATAIRYAELTDDPVAVIISTGQTVDFCFFSESIKSLPELTLLRNGIAIPESTATSKFNADPDKVRRAEKIANDIDITDWLGGKKSVTATEEVIGLGGYGKTLTVLSADSLRASVDGYDNEEEEEADLIESWTPRFHRR